MKLRYTNRARNDLELAFEWYEKQRLGLGFEFLDCIELALKEVLAFPEMYQLCYFNFRRNVIRRFPFLIFYTLESNEIIIHAIFDNRQNPEKRPKA